MRIVQAVQQMVAGHVGRCAPRTGLQGRGRRKTAVARLGGHGKPRRRYLGTTVLRRLRLRWLAALYRRALRRLRAACASGAVQSVLEGVAMVGAARLDAGV